MRLISVAALSFSFIWLVACSSLPSKHLYANPYPKEEVKLAVKMGWSKRDLLMAEKIEASDFAFNMPDKNNLIGFLNKINTKNSYSFERPTKHLGTFCITDLEENICNNILFTVHETNSSVYCLRFYQIENWGISDEIIYYFWMCYVNKEYFHKIWGRKW